MDRRQFKAGSIFRILEEQIKSELREYREFVEEASINLNDKIDSIEKRFEEVRDTEIEEEEHYRDFLSDEYWRYDKFHSKFTYNPMLLFVYGFFEHWLKKLCEYDNRRGFSNISVSDLNGTNYIEKSLLYFEKVAEISLSELDADMKKIQKIQQIRNLITHNDSSLYRGGSKKNYNKELYKFLKSEKHIHFDSETGDFNIKHKDFILDLVELIEGYLITVSTKVSSGKVVAKNTSVPHDMTIWGIEKSESLLQDVICGLDMLDWYDERTDEFKLEDTMANVRSQFASMSWNLTKLLSFFSNGEWETTDRDTIVNERTEGLEKLKQLYNN